METVRSNHAQWNIANGFRGGHVYSIAQTRDGYLWIGSATGLVRFDGVSFASIRQNSSDPMVNPSIVGIATDDDGQVWATNGLQMFRSHDGQLESGLPVMGQQPYQDIVISKAQNGDLLFGAGFEGVFSYHSGKLTKLVGPRELRSGPLALQQTRDGTLWIGTHTGLFSFKLGAIGKTGQRIEPLPDTKVNSLLPLPGGAMLVATDKGLWTWENGRVTHVDVSPEFKSPEVLALTSDLHGSVWIGTDLGLFKATVDNSHRPNFHALERLTGRSAITVLFEDREGSMWAGGLDGIERYRENAFATYLISQRSRSESNGPVYVDNLARTWFGPSQGGLSWFRGNLLKQVDIQGSKNDGVYSLSGGGTELWVGWKHGGLTRIDLNSTISRPATYTVRNGLAQGSVYSVFRSRDGTVWAGTLNGGLSRSRHGVFETFTTRDGLPSNTISAIAEGSSSTFIGTPNGLAELRDDRWFTYTVRDGMPPGAVDCLFNDRTGTLWIGTTKGICFLHSGSIHVPARVPDPLSNEVLGIAESEDDWLWISTPDRVLRVKKQALYGSGVEDSDYREYGVADGLPSAVGVKRCQSVVRDDQGRVWFSLGGGISVVQSSVLQRQSLPAAIQLGELLIDERAIGLHEPVRIASGRHRLTFRFASVSLDNPDQIRYRYRLDNYDSGWSDPVVSREATYTNLPPGLFRFRVMARNPDGLWSGREASVDLRVEPAYWQTRWFQLACLAVLALVGSGLYRLRVLQLTRQLNVLFDERLAERNRIGRELHDTLLQNLTGLSLQISGIAKMVKEPAKACEGLQELKRQAEDCVRETRRSVWDIRSTDADVKDLPNTLKHSGQHLTAGKGVSFEYACEGKIYQLPEDVRQHLLRIASEAIGNAIRHAHATKIQLKLRFRSREMQLLISDDGVGFDIAATKELSGHFGLATMTERAQQIGASIQIASTAEQGTSISVRVPKTS